ncbi:ADP-ribosylglycohydrolase family protein [Nucisporomicrobium flavum]|jgi:ADP-ribosylglycohydrolase|uniref:ADP-ribosylglycohydrolase family protein n=1 Tax=Nucisporomicrobium flavum TaxID=2785915 RepID=UPI0018F66FAC|nr:ADP-ribosylglycohydrolase family protein [Nucisporomicrobium flavum]
MSFTLFPDTRAALAADSLTGLSVGDAFGAQYFVPGVRPGTVPPPPWPWTDDTEEACCLLAALTGGDDADLDRDRFAALLGRHFDPYRGYGPGAVVMLRQIREGTPWPIAAAAAFDGQGSAGNGAAMRAAPLGAWHADSPARAAAQGALAAEVTHAHPEGIAGGVAVTVAASVAAAARLEGGPVDLLGAVLAHTPHSRVRDGLVAATRIRSAQEAAYELGTGTRAMAQDTVPFALWVAAHHLEDFRGAVEACVAAGGDMDTTAAMAGGVVAARTGAGGVPAEWIAAREPLPEWVTASREA